MAYLYTIRVLFHIGAILQQAHDPASAEGHDDPASTEGQPISQELTLHYRAFREQRSTQLQANSKASSAQPSITLPAVAMPLNNTMLRRFGHYHSCHRRLSNPLNLFD